jgi:hypothetical protein
MLVKTRPVADKAAFTRQVQDKQLDAGIVVPAGFIEGLRNGSSPTLTVIPTASPSFGADCPAASLDRVEHALAGLTPAAAIRRVSLPAAAGRTDSSYQAIGARRVFVLVGVGLLIGDLLRFQTQLTTWSSFILLPLIAPALVVSLPAAQTMRLGVNAYAGRALLGAERLSLTILVAWAGVYGLVSWRPARREAP